MLKFLCHIIRISIHAPTRGATERMLLMSVILSISIHAPTRGATFLPSELLLFDLFQSTLLQEERLNVLDLFGYIFDFNPRSYKRSD